jgi:hypothetical protein
MRPGRLPTATAAIRSRGQSAALSASRTAGTMRSRCARLASSGTTPA